MESKLNTSNINVPRNNINNEYCSMYNNIKSETDNCYNFSNQHQINEKNNELEKIQSEISTFKTDEDTYLNSNILEHDIEIKEENLMYDFKIDSKNDLKNIHQEDILTNHVKSKINDFVNYSTKLIDENNVTQLTETIKKERTEEEIWENNENMNFDLSILHEKIEIKEENFKEDESFEMVEFQEIENIKMDETDKFEKQNDIKDPIKTNKGEFTCNHCLGVFTTASYCQTHETRCSNNINVQPISNGGDTYPCMTCSEKFNSTIELIYHEVKHKLVNCSVCNKQFTKSQLTMHMMTHAQDKITGYKCTQCNKIFTSICVLNSHMLKHSIQKTFQKIQTGQIRCNTSEKTLTTDENYQIQEKRYKINIKKQSTEDNLSITDKQKHENNKQKLYKCDKCNNKFKTKIVLQSHLCSHSGVGIHNCNLCSKQFATASSLEIHIQLHSKDELICPLCDEMFNFEEDLKVHMLTHRCKYCDACFSSVGGLMRHMCTHNVEKPFKCTLCKQTFTSSPSLRNHMKTHPKERANKCMQCDKSFIYPVHLTAHMRSHTGERPYKCSCCDKTFLHEWHLRNHMKTHMGLKPFKCSVCNVKFTRSSCLRRHSKLHTREKSYKKK